MLWFFTFILKHTRPLLLLTACSFYNQADASQKPLEFEEMYKTGIKFRDGQVEGYPKNSPQALSQAAECFLPLAEQGDVKAIHNFAMIKYHQKDYQTAYAWLKKADELHFTPSTRNLERLLKEKPELTSKNSALPLLSLEEVLPLEIMTKIAHYLDDKSLLQLRQTSSRSADAVDLVLKTRSIIKLPLNCLVDRDIKHPYPYTVSYFIRNRFIDILKYHLPSAKTYKSLILFSDKWNYITSTRRKGLEKREFIEVMTGTS